MGVIRIASFNVFGIQGRDIEQAVVQCAQRMGPAIVPTAIAIGFQELFFQHQLTRVRNAWLGAEQQTFSSLRGQVRVWQSQLPGSWACLAPATPTVHVPGFAFDNSSGLGLCVNGRIVDAFFDRFRVGQAPDRFAHKGVLAVLVRQNGVRRAYVTTHLNNSSNDQAGGPPSQSGRARAWQIEQLANDLRWIDRFWNAPVCVVGDFNIDSIRAIHNASSVERFLYARLLSAARAPGRYFCDVNARAHANQPLRTSVTEPTAIDLHLLDRMEGRTALAFNTYACDSDHFLTESHWSEP